MKQAISAGINRVLRKPFDTDELIALMKENQPSDTKFEEMASDNTAFSLDGLSKMGDEVFVKDMVETFISSTKENLLVLDKSVAEEDWENAAEVLHKIIAPARHLKAEQVVNLLKKHELRARDGHPIPQEEFESIKTSTRELVEALQLHLQKTEK